MLNRTNGGRSITFSMSALRRDDGSTGGGLHNVQHVNYLWGFDPNTGSTPDLINSSGTVTLGTGQVNDPIASVWYNCSTTQCTFGNAQHPIPAHALILLQVQGTSD